MKILGLIVFIFFCGSIQAQPGDMPPNAQAGKCYAKLLIPDQYEHHGEDILYGYYGKDSTIIADYTIDTAIVLKWSVQKWVQRKADRNCFSADPNDCLVWCLVNNEGAETVVDTILHLMDTTITKEYETIYFERKTMIRKGGFTEWREIVCVHERTKSLLIEVRNALGLPISTNNATLDSETKAVLVKYQEKHGLPIGDLSYDTLRHMGIDWF